MSFMSLDYINIGMISFQRYGKEGYYCYSMGSRITLWDFDLSPVPFKPGEYNDINYS